MQPKNMQPPINKIVVFKSITCNSIDADAQSCAFTVNTTFFSPGSLRLCRIHCTSMAIPPAQGNLIEGYQANLKQQAGGATTGCSCSPCSFVCWPGMSICNRGLSACILKRITPGLTWEQPVAQKNEIKILLPTSVS